MEPVLPSSAPDFRAIPCAGAEALRSHLAIGDERAEFFDAAPVSSRAVLPGAELWAFRGPTVEGVPSLAAGIENGRRWQRGLLVVASSGSAPLLPGVLAFARSRRLASVVLDWVGEAPSTLCDNARRHATETYVVDLQAVDPERVPSKNHRRNIRRAREAGIEPLHQPDAQAADAHAELCGLSLRRRAERGEHLEMSLQPTAFRAYQHSGHARIYQMGAGGRPAASDLIVQIGEAAWYLSGGSSPEGMRIGASHLLMSEIIRELKSSGCRVLNLGLTETESLARFKRGFGAERVPITRLQPRWGSPIQRTLGWALRRLRR